MTDVRRWGAVWILLGSTIAPLVWSATEYQEDGILSARLELERWYINRARFDPELEADRLEMTPGSLFMIHDPSMMAFGNERDLTDSINLLRACKESILNMYERRIRVSRSDTADMMTAATWMDAKGAFERGFVDAIADDPVKYPVNAAEDRAVYAKKAEEGVLAWFERKKKSARPAAIAAKAEEKKPPQTVPESAMVTDPNRVKVSSTDTRLEELKY